MIVSHKYQFIFLKTGKVGGTSLEIALSKFLGPDDIITPISKVDDEKRYSLGYAMPRNYAKPVFEMGVKDLWLFSRRWVQERLSKRERKWEVARKYPRKFRNHDPAVRLKSLLGPEIWDNYFKFSIERNPWDKTVSAYCWDPKGKNSSISFEEFVRSGRSYDSNFEIYSIGGIPQADKIVRYEDLKGELSEVSKTVNLPEDAYDVMKNVKAKSGYRRKADYRDYYDNSLKELVGIQYAREIALMGYFF